MSDEIRETLEKTTKAIGAYKKEIDAKVKSIQEGSVKAEDIAAVTDNVNKLKEVVDNLTAQVTKDNLEVENERKRHLADVSKKKKFNQIKAADIARALGAMAYKAYKPSMTGETPIFHLPELGKTAQEQYEKLAEIALGNEEFREKYLPKGKSLNNYLGRYAQQESRELGNSIGSREATKAVSIPSDAPDLLATVWSSDYVNQFEKFLEVEKEFGTFAFPDNTFTYAMPRVGGIIPSYHTQPNESLNPAGMISDNVQCTLNKITTSTMFADEYTQDLVLPVMLQILTENIAKSHAYAREDALLNGATDIATGVNGAVYNLTHPRSAVNGLRTASIVTTPNIIDFAGGGLTPALMAQMVTLMSTQVSRSRNVKWVVPDKIWAEYVAAQYLGIEARTHDYNFTEKMATLKGFGGIPVVKTNALLNNMLASGVTDAAGTTSCILLVDFDAFKIGKNDFANYRVEGARYQMNQSELLSGTSRVTLMQDYGDRADDATAIVAGVNVV